MEESAVEIRILKGQNFDELDDRITDSKRIEVVLHAINSGSEIMVKFYPHRKLTVIYEDGKKEFLLLSGNYLKFRSKTYSLPHDLERILIR